VLGLEEVTAYFHLGLTEDHLRNNGANFGVRTFRECRKDISFSVKTVQAVFEVEMGFDRVVSVEPKGSKLRLMSDSGQSTHIEVDYKFLQD
jgi:hypothetical protein